MKKAEQAIRLVINQIEELDAILSQVAKDREIEVAQERLQRWKSRTTILLSKSVHPLEGKKFEQRNKQNKISGEPLRNFGEEAELYRGFLITLKEALEQHPEDIINVPIPLPNQNIIEIENLSSSNNIFIIHGHDELNLYRLKDILANRWNLDATVLSGTPGKGRTLIEKFETEAQRANFAIALLTPDDIITDNHHKNYAQARPNVIFELGWFYGRLGRNRVCILFKQNTHIHSDLDGISRSEFSESVIEKVIELENELVAAGILQAP